MKTQCFHDFDAFAASVRDVESKMMLRNPKRRHWSISSVDLDRINVQVGRLGSGNIAEGQLRSSGTMLYLPLTDAVEYSGNGAVLEKDSFAILEPGCEFCISTKVEHDWCAIFTPTDMLAHSELGESASRSETAAVWVTGANRRVASQCRALVCQIMTAAANCQHFESSAAAAGAAVELLKVAASVLGQRQTGMPLSVGRPKRPRQEIIDCSREWLEQREGKIVVVGELAVAADVSERTLRTAFNEYFGVGPVRYLQLRQLHQVRRALRAADPEEVSVSDVLVKNGVWEFSRFASRYRPLFGELPSETLHTTNRQPIG